MRVLFLFYELAAHQNANTESNDMTKFIGYPMHGMD